MKITKVDNGKFKATFKQDINNSSLENQIDKYFFDRNKTVGFRKDKKLFKFVGLRDGYSKQLELTIKSVIIDGVEKIAPNRVNFSELSLSGETVVHNINGLDFFNTIDLSNYKNLVKIEEEFTNLDIIYEVHLKGIKIYERGYQSDGKTHYRQNHLGQFLIVDEKNNNLLFSIENPVALDDQSRIYNILTHQLYKEGDKYYYKKTILDNPLGILPLYVDANITFNYTANSNIQSYANNNNATASWTTALNGAGMLFLNSQSNSINSFEYKSSQLITGWTHTGPGYFDVYSLDFIEVDFNDSDIAQTNWIEVVTGETINVSHYSYDFYGSDEPYIVTVEESGTTMTGTTYDQYFGSNNINHICLTGTTHISITLYTYPGDYLTFVYLDNFIVRKASVTATNYYESWIERQFLYFDTSQLYHIAINKMELGFTLDNPSTGIYEVQKANTASDTVITTSDFGYYEGNAYASFVATPGSYTLDLGQQAIDDFVDKSITKLVIREEDYDYENDVPVSNYMDFITHNWSYQLDVELELFVVTGTTILDFQLENTGFGVIYSQGPTYYDAWSGSTYTYVAHSSISGSYDDASTYTYDLANHELYRTFLNFDTAIMSIYSRYIIKSVNLVIQNSNYNNDISICKGTQDTISGLTSTEFMSFGEHYTDVEGIVLDSTVSVNLEPEVLSISGNTLFAIRNKVYDYEQNSSVGVFSSRFGVDFSQTYLQVELEPYLIDGVNYIRIEKGKEIDLYATRNTPEGEIYWGTDSGITNILGSGNTLHINTVNYNQGDYIYAAILNTSGETISYNVLSIYLDLYDLHFNNLPERNFNVHDVDLDAIYFKYHQCLSGVTYAYVRELDDAYEQNMEVSDGEGIGSYNMYNEWDIIDEFFSNSHEVEVVGKLDEINLGISYKKINEVYIHEGTRVLLYSTYPTENDGVYVADFNLKLHKTDELEDADKAFRYIAHVGAGDYLDYEFHTMYYSEPEPPPEWFEFDYLDPNIYGALYIDLNIDPYSSILFDSNHL